MKAIELYPECHQIQGQVISLKFQKGHIEEVQCLNSDISCSEYTFQPLRVI